MKKGKTNWKLIFSEIRFMQTEVVGKFGKDPTKTAFLKITILEYLLATWGAPYYTGTTLS